MLKHFNNYQEKIQYAKNLIALFNSDARFKKAYDKKSAFPDSNFNKMIGSDESNEATDIKHVFEVGKKIFSNLSDIAKVDGEPTAEQQQLIDQALNSIESDMAELYGPNDRTPAEKLNAYMLATNNTKVSKGVLPFVYSVVNGLDQVSNQIVRDINTDYLHGLNSMNNTKEIEKKKAVDCVKVIQNYASKYNMKPETLLSLSDDKAYVQVAKQAFASTIDIDKITFPQANERVRFAMDKIIDLELKRSDILRQNASMEEDGMQAIKGTYEEFVKTRENYQSIQQTIKTKSTEIYNLEKAVNKAKVELNEQYLSLGQDRIDSYKNERKQLLGTYDKVAEYQRIANAMARDQSQSVSADYAQKVEEMKQYAQELNGNQPCKDAQQMYKLFSAKLPTIGDELERLRTNHQAENNFVKKETELAELTQKVSNAKSGRSELYNQSNGYNQTLEYQKETYKKYCSELAKAYGNVNVSNDIEQYQQFAEQMQGNKDALLAKNNTELEKTNNTFSELTAAILDQANRYEANKGGLTKENIGEKLQQTFSDLNEIRNSSIKLSEQLPIIKEQEGEIYRVGNSVRACTATEQLRQMVEKLGAFMPDPEKPGNSDHYMAMHTAITNARNLYNGENKNISKEDQLNAVKAIKNAAADYLTAKGKQIRIWPFSSNQRYARILNAQSLEKTAAKMEEIANSMSPLEANFDKLLGPDGRYNTNDPKYQERLREEISAEAMGLSQPQKVNEAQKENEAPVVNQEQIILS